MKVYEAVKIEVVDFLKEDVLTESPMSSVGGVHEKFNDIGEWF